MVGSAVFGVDSGLRLGMRLDTGAVVALFVGKGVFVCFLQRS